MARLHSGESRDRSFQPRKEIDRRQQRIAPSQRYTIVIDMGSLVMLQMCPPVENQSARLQPANDGRRILHVSPLVNLICRQTRRAK